MVSMHTIRELTALISRIRSRAMINAVSGISPVASQRCETGESLKESMTLMLRQSIVCVKVEAVYHLM